MEISARNDNLDTIFQNRDILHSYLKYSAQFPTISYHDCLKIDFEIPNGQYLATKAGYEADGYALKCLPEDGFTFSDGQIYYDVSQTDYFERNGDYSQLAQYPGAAEAKQLIEALAEKSGIVITPSRFESTHYNANLNTIVASTKGSEELQAAELCDAYAEALVQGTSTQPFELMEAESAAVSILMRQQCGLAQAPANSRNLDTLLEAYAENRFDPEKFLERMQKINRFISEGITSAPVQAPAATQSRAQSITLESISENFLKDL